MTARFLKFFHGHVLPWEVVFKKGHRGDYDQVAWENVSGDHGGVTKYGIDQRSHPKTDIKNLTLAQAREIYWLEYWLPTLADHLPEGYGEALCDIRINGGNAVKMCQTAMNLHDAGLTVDGVLGPKTLASMADLGEHGLRSLLDVRRARYERLADKPGQAKFLQGWLNRNHALAQFVGVLPES